MKQTDLFPAVLSARLPASFSARCPGPPGLTRDTRANEGHPGAGDPAELAFSVSDTALGEVVRGKLDFYSIPRNNSNEVLAHAAGDMRHDLGSSRIQTDSKSCIGKCLRNSSLDFESFFFVGHTVLHRVSQTRPLLALNAIRVPVYQREQVIPIQLYLHDQLRRENVYFLAVDRSVWSFTPTNLPGKTLKRSLVSP